MKAVHWQAISFGLSSLKVGAVIPMRPVNGLYLWLGAVPKLKSHNTFTGHGIPRTNVAILAAITRSRIEIICFTKSTITLSPYQPA